MFIHIQIHTPYTLPYFATVFATSSAVFVAAPSWRSWQYRRYLHVELFSRDVLERGKCFELLEPGRRRTGHKKKAAVTRAERGD